MTLARFIKHTAAPGWALRRPFPKATLERIEAAIHESEARHRAQLVFAIEDALEPGELCRGLTGTERAREVFARLGIWDTAENCGILLYILLADRDVEIVADRGIHTKVGTTAWETICRTMENFFREGRFEEGTLAGIAAITNLLAREYPPDPSSPRNELPDRTVQLR